MSALAIRNARIVELETRLKQRGEPAFWYVQTGDTYRVGRAGWFGDQFEVLCATEFKLFESLCSRFTMELKDLTDD